MCLSVLLVSSHDCDQASCPGAAESCSALLQAVSDAWKTAGVRSTLMAGGTSLIAPQDVTAKLFDTITMSE